MALSDDQGSSRSGLNARSTIVNRTHRIVRERAAAMQAQKQKTRNLLVPVLLCSALLLFIASAVWSELVDVSVGGWEGGLLRWVHDITTDAGGTVSILLVWFLPISVITAAAVLLRRNRTQSSRPHDEVER